MSHRNPGRAAFLARRQALVEAAREAHGRRVDELVAEDLADEDLCRALAEWVRRHRREHGRGPTWADLAAQCRPDALDDIEPNPEARPPLLFRAYAAELCRGLAREGWISTGSKPGSMRPGRRLQQDAPQA
jgi:hypothetical protein